MKWAIESDELWLKITKSTPGWASIAFAKDMSKGDVLLIQKLPDDSSQLNVTNCYFRGHKSPNCAMTQQYTVVEAVSDKDSFSVVVKRPLKTTDAEFGSDVDVNAADVVWAYTKNDKLEFHGRANVDGAYGAVILKLVDGTSAGGKIGYKFGFLRHEYAQAIIWTVPVDMLILLARYFKGVPAWADIHLYVFMFLYLVSYVARNTQQGRIGPTNPNYSSELKSLKHYHKGYDFVLIGFATLQMIGGILLRIGRSTKSFSFQTNLKSGHIVGGILTWLTAKGFVIVGSMMYKSKFEDGMILYLVIAETVLFLLGLATFEMKLN